MLLKIRASSSNPSAPALVECSFEQFPVVVGRSPACDLTLPDDHKYVSSKHAEISLNQGSLTLTDTSANGTSINKSAAPVGRGNTVALSDGDTITMGEFELQLEIIVSQHPAPTPIDDHLGKIPGAPSSSHDPFSDLPRNNTPVAQAHNDPFGDIPAARTPNVTPNDPFAGMEDNAGPGLSSLQSDEHIDRLEGIGIGPSAWEPEPDNIPNDPFSDMDANDISNPGGSPVKSASPAATGNDDDDWAGWVGSIPDNSAQTPAPASPVAQAPVATASQPTIANSQISQSAVPASASSGSDEALNALLQSAGLNPSEFSTIDRVALGKHIGGMLKKSTQSMMLLLRSRDEIKNAMRADVTLLGAKGNSPLQFSLSVEDALKKLLTPSPTSGFSDANKAVDKGLQDIKIHQLAMLEAMRSSLQIALSHFDPEALAKSTRDTNPLASSLPLAREAKLWEQFQARYNDIKRETVDDFSDLFGKELRKAYEKSVNEMKRPTE